MFATVLFLPKEIFRGDGISLQLLLDKTLGGNTYWFTSALVISQLIFVTLFLTKLRNVWAFFFVGIGLSILGIWFERVNPNGYDFWRYKEGLMSMCYITLGGICYKYEKLMDKFFNPINSLALMLIYIAVIYIFKGHYNVGISTRDFDFYGMIIGILASLLLIKCCKIIPSYRILQIIGDNSLIFYFFSGIFPIGFSAIMHKLNSYIGANEYFGMLIVLFLSLVASYLTMLIVKRFFPWSLDFKIIWNKFNRDE